MKKKILYAYLQRIVQWWLGEERLLSEERSIPWVI
jgi:hypothetical protein